jgi:hypothetical protein
MLSRVFPLMTCAALLAAANGSLAPFEGKWKVNDKKTHATGVPDDFECQIKPDGDGIKVISKFREPQNMVYPLMWVGIMTSELPLSVDGSEKKTQIGPFAHVSRTTVEGNRMVTDWKAEGENGGAEGQWIRTVSPDGKEMTLQIISKASDGRTMDQTIVFQKR